MSELQTLASSAARGRRLDDTQVLRLADLAATDPQVVVRAAGELRDATTGPRITYSRKVFIPLTNLCRDACGYCTFAHPPIEGRRAFLTIDEVLAIAKQGESAGCREALFTLGEKPERKWRQARDELELMGFTSTIEYLAQACRAVLEHTSLLPHTNPGTLTLDEAATLKEVGVSQGMMLETLSERLLKRGKAHFGAPDKKPAARLATLENAGEAGVPFTTGILIGIGETPAERVDALIAIRDSHERHGHIQEVIVQNFRAKADTLMAHAPEPRVDEITETIALARLILPPDISLQAPPNLTPGEYGGYIDAGINDWGGVSPVTIDHVNPEAPWPKLRDLGEVTEARGYSLTQRLAIYPSFCDSPSSMNRWVHRDLRAKVLDATDGEGFPRTDEWYSGADHEPPDDAALAVEQGLAGAYRVPGRAGRMQLSETLDKAEAGTRLGEDEIALLFTSHGAETERLYATADRLRRETVGNEVTYVINRNINYTNMCYFKCGFCAFSKGPKSLNLRGEPYLLTPEEVAERAREAWELGATEVCMQGGIHHSFTADNYLDYLRAVKNALPAMHVHAFTALEVAQGARASGLSIEDFLIQLRDAGLKTLPGTAAEILDDDIRAIICPDKISTEEWCEVHRIAHRLGLRSNATIMFGTVEGPRNWARHLVVVRSLHDAIATDGHAGLFEFVPLPFVHMAAPIYLRGKARRGPTFTEALKMHAVARIALHGAIDNIQVSWVKMGLEGSKLALQAGANDLGGTLMNENISRAAGASHGQELTPDAMVELIGSIGRVPRRRTTLYETVTA